MPQKKFNILSRVLINTTIVAGSLAVSLLFAEWIVRTYMPCPDYGGGKRPALYSGLFEYDEHVGWKGVPNVRSPYFSKDFKVTVSHDALGFRNIYPPFIAGKKNYLLLGDSYGWGWGVEDNETAAAVFNKHNPDTNIYNMGIPGYGTDQEYIAMKKFMAEHPDNHYDGAILLFYYNDFENNAMPESYRYPKPFFSLGENETLLLQNVPVPIKTIPQDAVINVEPTQDDPLKKYQLLTLATGALLKLIFAPDHTPQELADALKTSPWENQNRILTAAIIADMKKFCAEHGMKFHVVFLITQNTDAHPGVMISALAKQLSSSKVDYSFFYSRTFPRTDLWLDTHYTPYGQSLLADHIYKTVNGMSESPGFRTP